MNTAIKIITLITSLSLICPIKAYTWDGYDWNNGTFVEIESEKFIKEGELIEVFDWNRGTFSEIEVTDVERYGSSVEIEAVNPYSGKVRNFDMD